MRIHKKMTEHTFVIKLQFWFFPPLGSHTSRHLYDRVSLGPRLIIYRIPNPDFIASQIVLLLLLLEELCCLGRVFLVEGERKEVQRSAKWRYVICEWSPYVKHSMMQLTQKNSTCSKTDTVKIWVAIFIAKHFIANCHTHKKFEF